MLFTKTYKLWKERKKTFFVYITASTYQVISKEVENRVFRQIAFLDKHQISDTQIGSWILFFLLLTVVFSEVHKNPRRGNRVTEKNS